MAGLSMRGNFSILRSVDLGLIMIRWGKLRIRVSLCMGRGMVGGGLRSIRGSLRRMISMGGAGSSPSRCCMRDISWRADTTALGYTFWLSRSSNTPKF